MEKNLNIRCKQNFSNLFSSKGVIGAVAEKALHNYESKKGRGKSDYHERLHYFAIGHAFKSILDKDLVFDIHEDEELKDKVAFKFNSLHLKNFDFVEMIEGLNKNNEPIFLSKDILLKLLNNIRNINSHFLHDLEGIRNISPKLQTFLIESFEFALIQSCLREKIQKRQEELLHGTQKRHVNNEEKRAFLNDINANETVLKNYIARLFYQGLYKTSNQEFLSEEQKQTKIELDTLLRSKDDWIRHILFVTVEADFSWQLNKEGHGAPDDHVHNALEIKAGTYLSFEGCLFLLTMFLYKNEANQLVPKLKGYKKNDSPENQSKLNVFTYFAKRFRSQDINSEERSLVKFRDILLYLNKYPTNWNRELETDSETKCMTQQLKDCIIKMEIKRAFPGFANNKRFEVFAQYELWGKRHLGKGIEKQYLDLVLNEQELKEFSYELYTNPIIKNAEDSIKSNKLLIKEKEQLLLNVRSNEQARVKKEIGQLEKSNKKNHEDIAYVRKERKELINPTTEKLKYRIEHNLLFASYGRNQDWFMEYAARFLAEINYFGKDALFKLYQFYSTAEQDAAMQSWQMTISKEKFDRLKFHQGKLTHFIDFKTHLEYYPNWDMPFVIENNAIHVKVKDIPNTLCIQRNLMIYFLEHALSSQYDLNRNGQNIVKQYYKALKDEKSQAKTLLVDTISREQKRYLKKILPKRLLHHYAPAISNCTPIDIHEDLLKGTEKKELRYKMLLDKAINEKNTDFFKNKNKGKNFKLQFIRKAWHIMYFKEQYLVQKEQEKAYLERTGVINSKKEHEKGHHKKFHITRDEFNDFCKWMYALDSVSYYKQHLENMFLSKGFYENREFKALFQSGSSIEDLYYKTIKVYKNWLKSKGKDTIDQTRFKLESYETTFEKGNLFINVSHFKKFLIAQKLIKSEEGKIIFDSLKTKKHLIPEYYYGENFDVPKSNKLNYKKCIQLFYDLKTDKLEDCLLYEIALYYFKQEKSVIDNARTDVRQILQNELVFKVEGVIPSASFEVAVPFKDLEKYNQLISWDTQKHQEGEGRSILLNLSNYLSLKLSESDLKRIVEKFQKNQRISLSDIVTINNHIISNQLKFINCVLVMEEYFIWKHKLNITDNSSSKEKNRLLLDDISGLKNYFMTNNNTDSTRNTAFHFNLPLGKSYQDSFKEKELKFITEEVLPLNISSFEQMPSMIKATIGAFILQMHNECYLGLRYHDFEDAKSLKLRHLKARNKYFDTIVLKQKLLKHA